jgi:hypothetical protein
VGFGCEEISFQRLCKFLYVGGGARQRASYVNTLGSHRWNSPQSAANGVQIKLRLLVGLVVSRYQTPLQVWAAIKTPAPRKAKDMDSRMLGSAQAASPGVHEDGLPLMPFAPFRLSHRITPAFHLPTDPFEPTACHHTEPSHVHFVASRALF